MADRRSTVPLSPIRIASQEDVFAELCKWPFTDSYVTRLLRNDVPQRRYSIWIYTDPSSEIVGFGTLTLCTDYGALIDLPDGHLHPYIPLLAVHPDKQGRGHGTEIVKHLVGEAATLACLPFCHHILFLDVYQSNEAAIKLYTNGEFQIIGSDFDPQEKQSYHIMARSVATSA